ncbi:hypothetical protein ABPG75_002135 [Micractinium tetrahymenae]
MAPRRSGRRAAASAAAAPILLSLPDELILQVLAQLNAQERYRESPEASLARLEELSTWLASPAMRHVRCLSLSVRWPSNDPFGGGVVAFHDSHAAVTACLQSFAVANRGGVQALTLHVHNGVCTSAAAWLRLLPSLRSLALRATGRTMDYPDDSSQPPVHLPHAARELRSLQRLELEGGMISFNTLPPGITRLGWADRSRHPYWLGRVAQSLGSVLRSLTLRQCSCAPSALDALSGLHPLEHLAIQLSAVPTGATLGSLTQLRALSLHPDFGLEEAGEQEGDGEQGFAGSLEAALPQLQNLEALALVGLPLTAGMCTALGGSLRHLRCLVLCSTPEGEGPAGSGLPPQACLRRLHCLAVDCKVALAHVEDLRAASQLHRLAMLGACGRPTRGRSGGRQKPGGRCLGGRSAMPRCNPWGCSPERSQAGHMPWVHPSTQGGWKD